MLGRLQRNTSVLDLLVFISVAAIGIMEVAIITTPVTAVIITTVIIRIGMGTTITAAVMCIMAVVMRIMVADMDITAEVRRCRPSDLTRQLPFDRWPPGSVAGSMG
jgi:hypothetical protein